jgi:predicted flap endonuclease-1-like 5' DNA nuclease
VIVHLGEVWIAFLVTFAAGCVAGVVLFRGVARTRFAHAQAALAGVLAFGRSRRSRFAMPPALRPVSVAPAMPAASLRSPATWGGSGGAGAGGEALPATVDEDDAWLAQSVDLDRDAAEPDAAPSPTAIAAPAGMPAVDLRREVAPTPQREPLDDTPPRLTAPVVSERVTPRTERERPVPFTGLPRKDGNDAVPAPVPRLVAPIAQPPAPIAQAQPLPVDDGEIRRPVLLMEPRNGVPDDLQRIKGIGARNEIRLNKLGIFHFSQIAAWTPAEIRWVGEQLAFPDRIQQDDWVGQAILLASGTETGFTKSAERRRTRRRRTREESGGSDD